jgi:hypothetical protein
LAEEQPMSWLSWPGSHLLASISFFLIDRDQFSLLFDCDAPDVFVLVSDSTSAKVTLGLYGFGCPFTRRVPSGLLWVLEVDLFLNPRAKVDWLDLSKANKGIFNVSKQAMSPTGRIHQSFGPFLPLRWETLMFV